MSTGMLIRIYSFHKPPKEIFQPEFYRSVLKPQITIYDHKFKNSGNQCADCCSCNAHGRSPEFSKDENIVCTNIYQKGANGSKKRHLHFSDISQNDRARQRKSKQEISNNGPTQVLHTICNDPFLRCIDLHDLRRKQKCGNCKKSCNSNA